MQAKDEHEEAQSQAVWPHTGRPASSHRSCLISTDGSMWTATKNKLKKLSPSGSWRSRRTTSSRDNMSFDSSHRDTDSQEDTTPTVPRSHVQTRIRVLTSVEQLVPQNDYEREPLDLLKNQAYHHVRIFKPFFFIKMGLKADMMRAFSYAGLYNFADMTEAATISFAMAKKINLSPVMSMLAHWQKMIPDRIPIDITTLVTRIAMHVKALDNAQVTYLPWEEYQLKVGPSSSARYGYENQIMSGISDLMSRVNTMGQR
ncbi:hypothetical protein C2845_PM11G03550 [Panicum miliaceum]|uniref:Uncharacterized protein n=1 Tax=Panicum miliaceum TaxID=4540 RepID=A0A3L6RTY6_PANMI|nr:hypothetical protein C2845_PM11G03550 [Panicum miliaceum]